MPNPFDQFDTAPPAGAVQISGPDPYKVQDQQLQSESARTTIAKNRQDIANNPLEIQSKQQSISSSQAGVQNQAFNRNQGLRQEFSGLPLVKNYATVTQKVGSALSAPSGPQGDLAVLYAFATVMDPNSVVRESEQDMAANTASRFAQLQQQYHSFLNGNGLPAGVRQGLIETMRKNLVVINGEYNQQRGYYSELAKRNGFDPFEIVGPHLAEPINRLEADYIRAHGGTPKINGVAIDQPGEKTIDDQPQNPNALNPDQQARDQAFLATRPSPEQYQAFLAGLTGNPVPLEDASARLSAALDGKHSYSAKITDPNVEARVAQLQQEQGTGVDSAARRGGASGYFMGANDEIRAGATALGGALLGEGSIGDLYNTNLRAEQAYQSGLRDSHPLAYGAGEFAGALVPGAVSFGASTPVGMARAGAAFGGAYGFNTGEGGIGNRAANAVEGAAAGAALGVAAPEFLGAGIIGRNLAARNALLAPRAAPKTIPSLVDAASGRLNEPLEAMRPGQRVAAAREFGIDLPLGSATDRGGAIVEKGLDNLPGSAGVMNDARRTVEGQVQNAVEDVAGRFGSSRTLNEGGGELQRGINEWMDRADRIAIKVYHAVPIKPLDKASVDNTVGFLKEATSRFQSNPNLAEELRDPTLSRYLTALGNKKLSWEDLTGFRTFIGNKIGEFRFSQDARAADFRALYGALSEDMRATAANKSPQALRAFERANSFYAGKEQRIDDALVRLLGNDAKAAPEKAALAVQKMTEGGKSTADLAKLAQVRASTVKSGAWDEIAATMIRMGGQPANSPGRAFDPSTFVRWYSDMDETARKLLFKSDLRTQLDRFVMVNQRLANSNALRNTSNTVPNFIGTGFAGASGAAMLTGNIPGLLAIGAETAANYGMAKLWTKPEFVRWATGYSRAALSGNTKVVNRQVGKLSQLASTNPELRNPIQSLLASLANDNFTPGLAASQSNEGDQRQ